MKEGYQSDVKKFPIMASLMIASFFSFLGETLLNVALPRFMEYFGISAATAGWLITGYLLVIGVFVPAAAYLIRKFRTRILYLSALGFFLTGTVICALAVNFPMLLSGRFIQAVGTAIMIPLNLNVILALNPPEKRGTANGLYILVLMFAPSIGPTLSGIILEHFMWRALFWLMIPFIIFSIVMAVIFMRDVTKTSNPKFDVLSMILSATGFGCTIYGLSIAGTFNLKEIFFISFGLISLTVFVFRQFRIPNPMLDLRVFRYGNFRIAVIFISVSMIALFSNLMMMPIFLQKVLGITAFTTGLIMMPGGLVDGFMAPVSGRIYDKFGGKYLLVIGSIIICSSLFYLSFLTRATEVPEIIAALCVLSLGVPFVMTSAQTGGLNSLPPKFYPHGTAVLNTVQQIAASVGSSFFIMIMSRGQNKYILLHQVAADSAQALAYGIRSAYSIGSLFAIPAVVMALYMLMKGRKI